jgi:hypothetical protein
MPGQSKSVVVEFDDKYVGGRQYQILIEGWKLDAQEVRRA